MDKQSILDAIAKTQEGGKLFERLYTDQDTVNGVLERDQAHIDPLTYYIAKSVEEGVDLDAGYTEQEKLEQIERDLNYGANQLAAARVAIAIKLKELEEKDGG